MNPASSFLFMHMTSTSFHSTVGKSIAQPTRIIWKARNCCVLNTSRETKSMEVKSDVGSAASKFRSFSSSFYSISTEEKAVVVGPPWSGHCRGLGRPLDDASASILGGIGPQCAQFDCILGCDLAYFNPVRPGSVENLHELSEVIGSRSFSRQNQIADFSTKQIFFAPNRGNL